MKYLVQFFLFIVTVQTASAQSLFYHALRHDPGDKLIYILKQANNVRPSTIEYVFSEVSDIELVGFQIRDGKVAPIKTAAYGTVEHDICWDNGQRCVFDPPLRLFDKHIRIGDQWSNRSSVKGEDFSSKLTQDVRVVKQELITLRFGSFDAIKIEVRSKISGADSVGRTFNGTSFAELWVAIIGGKLTLAKVVHSDSFRNKYTVELDSPIEKSN